MEKVNKRYTNDELLELLQIFCTDFNKQPTQREILSDDRFPTHHTYIARFGSLKNAIKEAGLADVKNLFALHDIVKNHLIKENIDFEEFYKIGNIIVDFLVFDHLHEEMVAIDIVNVDGFANKFVANRVKTYREILASEECDNYICIGDLLQVIKLSRLVENGRIRQ